MWYVVWNGRKRGLYSSWQECEVQVKGFPGAQYKAFKTKDLAEKAFRGSYEDYVGKHVSSLNEQELAAKGKLTSSDAVDAAFNGTTQIVEYRCVNTETGEEIFRQGPFEHGTNNVGEFLAIVHALRLFKRKGIKLPIYSDSRNGILWVQTKQCRTSLKKDDKNAELFRLINRGEKWLAENDYENEILKWETEAWGENPADFGRK
jgi:ribonuclease HI